MHSEQLFVRLIYEQDGWQAGWPGGAVGYVTSDREYSTLPADTECCSRAALTSCKRLELSHHWLLLLSAIGSSLNMFFFFCMTQN